MGILEKQYPSAMELFQNTGEKDDKKQSIFFFVRIFLSFS
jgi:hypothetical protein